MFLLIFRFWTATVLTFLKIGLKLLKDKALEIIPKYGRTEAQSWPQGSGKNNKILKHTSINTCLNTSKCCLQRYQDWFQFVIFLTRHIFAIFVPTCWLAFTRNIKFHISHLFSLRRFRTVETIPIYKSRDDGADM